MAAIAALYVGIALGCWLGWEMARPETEKKRAPRKPEARTTLKLDPRQIGYVTTVCDSGEMVRKRAKVPVGK